MPDYCITLFEYQPENLAPLTLTRPVHALACGCFLLKERIIKKAGKNTKGVYCMVRKDIEKLYSVLYPEKKFGFPPSDSLFINSGLMDFDFLKNFEPGKEKAYFSENKPVAFYLKKSTLDKLGQPDMNTLLDYISATLPIENVKAFSAGYLWELVDRMPEMVEKDFKDFYTPAIHCELHPSVIIYGKKDNVYIAQTAHIHPHVVIDTHGGPVVIEDGAEIHPFSRIEGPSYIGRHSVVLGAKIRSGSYIGKKCRVGGEVENSVLLAHSNKYHEGFLGHSYVGEWVNLGALTTNSDLKNNYSEVDVPLNGKKTLTGSKKVGCFIGDHSKTSIGCLFNTGTFIGVMANILASGGLLPKYIPSFANYSEGRFVRNFPVNTLLDTAAVVKSRRDELLEDVEREHFRNLLEESKDERQRLIGK